MTDGTAEPGRREVEQLEALADSWSERYGTMIGYQEAALQLRPIIKRLRAALREPSPQEGAALHQCCREPRWRCESCHSPATWAENKHRVSALRDPLEAQDENKRVHVEPQKVMAYRPIATTIVQAKPHVRRENAEESSAIEPLEAQDGRQALMDLRHQARKQIYDVAAGRKLATMVLDILTDERIAAAGRSSLPDATIEPPEAQDGHRMVLSDQDGRWLFTDECGQRWRLTETGDESLPLLIEAVSKGPASLPEGQKGKP